MRCRCVVPHCPATRGDRKGDPVTPDMEWICSRHWAAVPRARRRVWSRVCRRFERELSHDAYEAKQRVWDRLKGMATERGVGL